MQRFLCAVLWLLLTLLAAAGAQICPADEEAKDFDTRAWGDSDDAGFLQLQVVKEPARSPKTGREEVAAQEATLAPEELSFPRGRMYSRFTWFMQTIRPLHTTWRHVLGVVGACVATFSINFIDVVWIMPFLNDKADGTWNIVLFVAISQILATLSIIIFAIKDAMEEHHHDGSLERSIDLATAFLLGSYGFYLLYEDLFCHAPSSPEKAIEDSDDARCSKQVARGGYGRRKFMILCLVGGIDEIAVYVPVLTSRVLNGVELELGVLMSRLASVAMCLFLGRSEFLKRAVEAIPLWLIALALGAVSFTQYIRAS